MRKWFEDFITQDEDGSWSAWDETQANCIGNYADRSEAILAVVRYAKRLHKETGLDTRET